MAKYLSLKDRLIAGIKEINSSGCWIWGRYIMKNGYGSLNLTKGTKLAHRLSYELFSGDIGIKLDVMHSCDNPACINPKHLSLGTRAQNMLDAKNKGRSAIGIKHGKAKLNEKQVKEIIQLNLPQKVIASMYGISQGHVSEIKSALKWAHI